MVTRAVPLKGTLTLSLLCLVLPFPFLPPPKLTGSEQLLSHRLCYDLIHGPTTASLNSRATSHSPDQHYKSFTSGTSPWREPANTLVLVGLSIKQSCLPRSRDSGRGEAKEIGSAKLQAPSCRPTNPDAEDGKGLLWLLLFVVREAQLIKYSIKES